MKQIVQQMLVFVFILCVGGTQLVFAEVGKLEATKEDIQQLEDEMNGELYYFFGMEFESTNANVAEVIAPLAIGLPLDEEKGIEGGSKDPLWKISGSWGCRKISAAYLDALLSDIFHISPDHNYVDESNGWCHGYYYDGYYYYQPEGLGGPIWIYDCEDYRKLADGRYYITAKSSLPEENETDKLYLLADLRWIRGERTWTFYRVSDKPLSPENATDEARIFVNGEKIIFDEKPYIRQGNTMVPMRAIFEALGANVSYEAQSKKITAEKDGTQVLLWVGQRAASVDGALRQLPTAVVNQNGSAMVPLRFVSEAFGAEVAWDAGSKTVTIRL